MPETNSESIRQAVENCFYQFLLREALANREMPIEKKTVLCYNVNNCDKRQRGGAI